MIARSILVTMTGLMLSAGAPIEARSLGFTPATLSIAATDGRDRSAKVQSAQQVRGAIKPCLGKIQCEEISFETCDRCVIYAAAVEGGYHIYSRLGPPGPLYQLYDKRAGRQSSTVFSLRDTTTIFIDYLAGRETIPLGRRDTGEI